MLCFVVDALRRELRDVDDTTRSFDDFFFFFTEERRSIELFIYLFIFSSYLLLFSFRLFIYVYVYVLFFPPFFGKRGDSRFSQERAGDYVPSLLDAQMLLLYFPRFQCQLISLSLSFFLSFARTSLNALFHSLFLSVSLSLFFLYTQSHTDIYIYICVFGEHNCLHHAFVVHPRKDQAM